MNNIDNLSMIVPVSARDDCNNLMRALGRDDSPAPGRTFSVALSSTGDKPATHYGSHTIDPELVDLLSGGAMPSSDWPSFGLDESTATAALGEIIHSAGGGFDALLSAHGLKRCAFKGGGLNV